MSEKLKQLQTKPKGISPKHKFHTQAHHICICYFKRIVYNWAKKFQVIKYLFPILSYLPSSTISPCSQKIDPLLAPLYFITFNK